MTTTTYADILGAHSIEVPAHLEAQAEVPVKTGLQVQGDVIFIPTRASADVGRPVPPEGVAVVRGESGGHTHLLVGEGVMWAPVDRASGQDMGVFTVPMEATAWMLHEEHGAMGFGPGAYIARRQREQADEIRVVAD